MSKFPMDLSKFKKISSDDHVSILRHDDGHELKIAHSKLSPGLKAKLEKLKPIQEMQKLADGGPVEDQRAIDLKGLSGGFSGVSGEDYAKMMEQRQATPVQTPVAIPSATAGESVPVFDIPLTAQPVTEAPKPKVDRTLAQVAKAPTAPAGIDLAGPLAMQQAGLEKMKAGEQETAKAQAALGVAEAKKLDEYATLLKKSAETFNKRDEEIRKEREDFVKDITAGHIQPRRVIENMSTGGKIMTGIGLILGGFGAGLTGQPNLAAKFLDDQIARDIDAQKAELGKKQNLLSFNFQKTQDLRQAEQMTRMQLNDVISAQLKAEAGRAKSAEARGMLQTIAGKYDFQSGQIQQQLSKQRMLMDLATKPSGDVGASDEQFRRENAYLQAMGEDRLVQERQKKFVPGVGMASVEVPEKVRSELIARQDLQHKIEDLARFAAQHSGEIFDRATINEGRAKAALVQDAYRRANAQGVFKESEKEFVGSIVADDPTQFFNKYRAQRGYQEMMKDNLASLNATRRGYGLPSHQSDVGLVTKEGQKGFLPGVGRVMIKDGKVIPLNE